MGRLTLVLGAALLALAGCGPLDRFVEQQQRPSDEGWTIERFAADIAVEPNGTLLVKERIDVDFGALEKHGIFRRIPYRYRYGEMRDRVEQIHLLGVTDAAGRALRWDETSNGVERTIRIGDPDRTVSGRQSYVITYRVFDALNPFADHDELYWNVNGAAWPVRTKMVTAAVTLPRDGVQKVACYEGPTGSTEPCTSSSTARGASFAAARGFALGEQLTVVVAMQKGVVPQPIVRVLERERQPDEFFMLNPANLALSVFVLLAGLTLVGARWYAGGRDRTYTTNYYLTNDPAEDVQPLFGSPTIVPEFEPPDTLRPAQVGLLLDESADPKDLTATIVDLAARGYLTIAEHGPGDWLLERVSLPSEGVLAEYERVIFEALFAGRTRVAVSELKGTFAPTLRSAQTALYENAQSRGWFAGNPEKVRGRWAGLGCLLVVAGVLIAFVLGGLLGAGLVGVAVGLLGIVTLVTARAMASRTAKGSDLLRRILGFRLYMLTAEKERQRFAEREKIFSAYLPYAIVFGCVGRWVAAFRDLGAAAVSWYTGAGAFDPTSFSTSLQSFSSGVSSSLVQAPSTPGSSGFSGGGGGGGFSGGGSGGGGGGSW